jgi:hypothetical protein
MFRQEFPERNFPSVSQDDGTLEILRLNLGYCLAAPPARSTQNPSIGHRHNGQNVVSLAFSMSATAATSAQKPNPHAKSMQMPVYILPFAVRMAAPTEPAEKCSPYLKAPHTAFADAINVDLASSMSLVSPNH